MKLCLSGIINQVCLCMLGRLSSSGYGNKLDCSPTREAETLNGAKDSAFSSSFCSPSSNLDLYFPAELFVTRKKKFSVQTFPGHIHSSCFGEVNLYLVPKLNSYLLGK